MGSYTRLTTAPTMRERYISALEAGSRLNETYSEFAVIVCMNQEYTFGQADLWRSLACIVQSVAFAQTRPRPAQRPS
jgi:hypothetical protein